MNLRVGRSPFFIQRNKFTLSIRIRQIRISHFHSPFSILFCSVCCNICSFLFSLLWSALLYCTVLFLSLSLVFFCSVYFLAKK